MKILKRMRKLNNRGFSLVELICAIGIMTLIGASVAGIMSVSANTFSRNSAEADLQQEAQQLVNQIANIVQDSKDATYSGGVFTIKCGVTVEHIYKITHDASAMEVKYTEDTNPEQLMAEHIKELKPDVSEFDETGLIKLYVKLENGDKTFAGNYTVSSRNVPMDAELSAAKVLLLLENEELILEPLESYNLVATVTGTTSDNTVTWKLTGNTDTATKIDNIPGSTDKKIVIGKDEKASELTIVCRTNEKKDDGITPKAQKSMTVHVRRVNKVNLEEVSAASKPVNGAAYKLRATLEGNNLDKKPTMNTDKDWSYLATYDPRAIKWIYVYHVGSNKYCNGSSQLNNLISVSESGGEVNVRLKKDIGDGEFLEIIAIAKHPEGKQNNLYADAGAVIGATTENPYNKTGSKYDCCKETYILFKSLYTPTDGGQGILRGADKPDQGTINNDLLRALVDGKYGMNTYPGSGNIVRAHRFKAVQVDGEGKVIGDLTNWTKWRYVGSHGEHGDSVNVRPPVTKSLECNQAYAIEIKISVIDGSGNVLWPFDDTKPEQYTISGIIKRVSVKVNIPAVGETKIDSCVKTIKPDTEIKLIYNEVIGAHWDNYLKDHVKYYTEIFDEEAGDWRPVDKVSSVDTNGGSRSEAYYESHSQFPGMAGSPLYTFKPFRRGHYRIKVRYEGVPRTRYNPGEDEYRDTTTWDEDGFDEATGFGIYEFYVDDSSDTFYDWDKCYFNYNGKVYYYTYSHDKPNKKVSGKVYEVTGSGKQGSGTSVTVNNLKNNSDDTARKEFIKEAKRQLP